MKKQIRFIVNPFSGIGKKGRLELAIKKQLDHQQYNYEIVKTERVGHATQLAEQAVNDKVDIAVAVGGDGSVNEVAKALIGTETILGILPAGSGNGFAMHLGLGRNFSKAIPFLNQGKIIQIDTCKMNDHAFINLAGVGFQALVANKLKESRLRGFTGYTRFVVQESFNYKTPKFEIIIDGKKIERECLLIEVANAPMFGYNFEIAPHAKLNDGILEVVVIKKLRPWQFPYLAWHSLRKSLEKNGLAENFSGKNIVIKLKEETAAHFDGEGLIANDDLHFSINPLSLKVQVPN